MNSPLSLKQLIIFAVFIGVVLIFGTLIMPWYLVKWGTVSFIPGETVTVYGEARTEQKSQVASFSAGVSVVNSDKDAAISQVNKGVEQIITAVKEFGIPDEDVKTQSISIYQGEELFNEEGVQRSRQGQWRVSNTVEVKLRDVDRASELAEVLTQNGANNIYGPNFTLDDTNIVDNTLLNRSLKSSHSTSNIAFKYSAS